MTTPIEGGNRPPMTLEEQRDLYKARLTVMPGNIAWRTMLETIEFLIKERDVRDVDQIVADPDLLEAHMKNDQF